MAEEQAELRGVTAGVTAELRRSYLTTLYSEVIQIVRCASFRKEFRKLMVKKSLAII